jgi:DNA-directed RNA polymerase subunit M/transcription elongation factor TFIIS
MLQELRKHSRTPRMPNKNSNDAQQAFTRNLTLIQALESGVLDAIECPKCCKHTITVRFTQPRISEIRTWFLCTNCTFRLRVQNSTIPRYFSIDRLDEQLEAYDDDVLTKAKK